MAITKTPRANVSVGGSGGIKFIDGIPFEGLGSGGFDDNDFLIIGDELDNTDLIGGEGHDEIRGGAGNDELQGGAGNGILSGDDGNDDLDGQEGTEKLFGGNGDDILRAGGSIPANVAAPAIADHDRLTGGEGNDTFGFYGVGSFEITDFTLGQDRFFFDSEILGITNVPQLVSYITNIIPANGSNGDIVEFVGGAATIEIIGASVNDITAEMVVFTL